MPKAPYTVRDAMGRDVSPGDIVHDFRGRPGEFVCVARGPESGRSAKVRIAGIFDFPHDFYAEAFDLTITVNATN